jgi:hypothetical protein
MTSRDFEVKSYHFAQIEIEVNGFRRTDSAAVISFI